MEPWMLFWLIVFGGQSSLLAIAYFCGKSSERKRIFNHLLESNSVMIKAPPQIEEQKKLPETTVVPEADSELKTKLRHLREDALRERQNRVDDFERAEGQAIVEKIIAQCQRDSGKTHPICKFSLKDNLPSLIVADEDFLMAVRAMLYAKVRKAGLDTDGENSSHPEAKYHIYVMLG